MQLVATGGVLGHALQRVIVANFAHGRGAGVFVHQRPQIFQEFEVFGAAQVVDVALPSVGIAIRCTQGFSFAFGNRRIVAQLGVVEVEIDGIQAETVYAQIQPETHIVQLRLTCFRVMEVNVRLAGQEVMHIVLLAAGIKRPRRAAENR